MGHVALGAAKHSQAHKNGAILGAPQKKLNPQFRDLALL